MLRSFHEDAVRCCDVLIRVSLQEDYRKITVERKGETNFFTSDMIKSCMKKTVAVSLHQTVQVSSQRFAILFYSTVESQMASSHFHKAKWCLVRKYVTPKFFSEMY